MKVFSDGLFEGKVALITGGGTGIGFATALEMGRLGAKVAICSRKQEKMDAAAEKLRAAGIDHIAGTCNIRDRDEVEMFVSQVMDSWEHIDILVNNAGGQFPSPAAPMALKGWNAVIETNLTGTWNMTQVVAQKSLLKKGGVIVNVILPMGRAWPGVAHSGAARAAVANLTKSLAVEWAPFGVRVLAFGPGTIETEGTKQYPKAAMEALKQRIPWGRCGTPEEAAWAITYLASPAADFWTGEVLTMDGGQRYYMDQMPVRKIKE